MPHGPQEVFLVVDGRNVSGEIFTLEDSREFPLELPTEGFGPAWEESLPIGTGKVTLDAGADSFYNNKVAGYNEAFSGVADPVTRLVAWGGAGVAIGSVASMLSGLFKSSWRVLFKKEGLTRAAAKWALSGQPMDGTIIHGLTAKTTDPFNTQATSVDRNVHPNLPTVAIVSNTLANPSVVTTLTPHGLITGDVVMIAGVITSNPTINGQRTVTVISPTTFSVPVNVTTAGTGGTLKKLTSTGGFADQHITAIVLDGYTNFVGAIVHSADNSAFVPLVTFAARTTVGSERAAVVGQVQRYRAYSGDFGGAGGAAKSVTPLALLSD